MLKNERSGAGRRHDGERRRIARRAPAGITHQHTERRAVITARRRRGRIARARRPGNRRSVPGPLIAQRCRPRGGDRKGGRRAYDDCLILGLGCDGRRHRRGRYGERHRIARRAPAGITHHCNESRAVIAAHRGRSGIARTRRAGNRRTILVPLVTQRSGTGGCDAERRRGACRHDLALRLRCDRGGCIDGECCGATRLAAGGVRHSDRESGAIVGAHRGGSRIARARRAADDGAVPRPLIAQRAGTRGHHAERRRGAHRHRLILRRRSDHGGSADGQCCGIARLAA
jgi:hypothetical protein